MKIRFSFPTLIAFLGLVFVCHELHELIHTAVARWQCGCWGPRDFNVWNTCEACKPGVNTVWSTLAGPVLTYALIWIGFVLMNKTSPAHQSIGWLLVFANKPFARIFTVLMRGGDESVITRTILQQDRLSVMAWIIEIIIVLMLIVPPLVKAWTLIEKRGRTAIFVVFLIVPMLIEFALIHKLGNSLLAKGVLDETGILGSPLFVNLWTALWVLVLLVMWKALPSAVRYPARPY